MSHFVLDGSVTIAWCFEGQASAYADSVMARLDRERATVPSIWALELANAMLIGERRKKISRAEIARCLQMVAGLPITIDENAAQTAFGPILTLARDQNISAYDAAYLELAMREGIPLATRDEGLRTAARHAGVPLL